MFALHPLGVNTCSDRFVFITVNGRCVKCIARYLILVGGCLYCRFYNLSLHSRFDAVAIVHLVTAVSRRAIRGWSQVLTAWDAALARHPDRDFAAYICSGQLTIRTKMAGPR